MDVKDWKRLSRLEKQKVWDTLTQSEKQAILNARDKGRGSKKSRGGRANRSPWSQGRGLNHSQFSSKLLRGVSIGAAILAPVLLLLGSQDGTPGFGWLTPVLLLVLIAVLSYSMTLCIEIMDGILEETREATAQITRIGRETRSGDQEAQNASSASATVSN